MIRAGAGVAAIDPGIIHLGVVTDGSETLAVVGRGLRSVIQGHNRKKAALTGRLNRCRKGSRRWRKLKSSLRRSARRRDRIQRNLLHHAANAVAGFCAGRGIGTLAVGDTAELNRGKRGRSSRRNNQANGNNPLGQFYRYLEYKLGRIGCVLDRVNEAHTSRTCPACEHRHKPAGRVYRCRCGFAAPRDMTGAFNILNKYRNGRIEPGRHVPAGSIKYLRPAQLRRNVVDPLARGTLHAITLPADPSRERPRAD